MKDLVLVHGWGFGSAVWLPVVERLPPGLRVHLVDLPGYGSGNLSPNDLPAGATVCGWSLGAMLALQWAMCHPDKVARLALVGATPRFTQAADWPLAQPTALLDDFSAAVRANAAAALRRFAALANRRDDQARRLTRDMSRLLDRHTPGVSCLLEGLATLGATDLRDSLADLGQPALVIHGERDSLMPLAAGRWLAGRLPDGRLEVFDGAGHAPFLSDPQRFAALIANFANE